MKFEFDGFEQNNEILCLLFIVHMHLSQWEIIGCKYEMSGKIRITQELKKDSS